MSARKCVHLQEYSITSLMFLLPAVRGKKRAAEEIMSDGEPASGASSSTTPEPSRSARAREKQPATAPIKKRMCFCYGARTHALVMWRLWRGLDLNVAPTAKRAETRNCPVCDEPIPLRLLGKHAELESERLAEIIGCIGSTEVLGEAEPDDGCVPPNLFSPCPTSPCSTPCRPLPPPILTCHNLLC